MKKYLKIYEDIKNDIVKKKYQNGAKLPSKRSLSDIWGVSIVTVEHAYSLLIEEGYVVSCQKSGYFVSYSTEDFRSLYDVKNDKTQSDKASNDKLPDEFFSSDNLFEDSFISYDLFSKTVRKVLSLYPNEVLKKSPSFGIHRVRRSISDYLFRSRNIDISCDNIIIGAGAEYLYSLIVRTFGIDKVYGVETPGYGRIKEVYESNGAKTDMLLLGKNGIKSSELKRSDADILHITPYRSYPTGVTAGAGKKEEYLKWSLIKNRYIIEDDFESEFTPSKKSVDTLFSMDHDSKVIYVNTFTKTIAPCVRMAYMLIPDELLELFKEKVGFYSCPVPTLDQLCVSYLLDSGDFERHINRVRRKQRLNRKRSE